MGKVPNTYRPLRPARFRDDKELRLLPRPHPPNSACFAFDTSAAGAVTGLRHIRRTSACREPVTTYGWSRKPRQRSRYCSIRATRREIFRSSTSSAARSPPYRRRPHGSWYGFLLVSGNAYLEAVAVGGTARAAHAPPRPHEGAARSRWLARGLRVHRRRPLDALRYRARARRRPILHLRLFHPVNDYYGMSPIEAAASPSIPTTQRRAGTRRYSTTPRGLPAHSCMPRAKAS